MRCTVMILLVGVLVCVPAAAEEIRPVTAGLFIDAGMAEMAWSQELYLRGGFRFELNEMFAFTIPVTYISQPYGQSILDTGVNFRFSPTRFGAWLGFSLFQGISIHGEQRPSNWYHHMSEVQAGWTIPVGALFYVEPMVQLRDPGSIFSESLELVSDYAPGYSRVRFCLNIGLKGVSLGREDPDGSREKEGVEQ